MPYPQSTYPKYGAGGRFPKASKVLPSTDTGYLAYSSAGRLFLPAATNLCTNPRLVDGNADGLSESMNTLTNCTVTGSVEALSDGSGYIQTITVTGLAGVAATKALYLGMPALSAAAAVAQNDLVTGSVYIKPTVITGCTINVAVAYYDAASAYIGTTTPVNLSVSADYVRQSATLTCSNASASRAVLHLNIASFHEGDTFTISYYHPMLEKSSILTPYFDGSSPERGCSWNGAANASTSARASSVLIYPFSASSQALTVAAKVTPLFAATDGLDHQFFSPTVTGGWGAFTKNAASQFAAFFNDGVGTGVVTSGVQNFSANTSHTLVVRQQSKMDMATDGTTATQTAVPGQTPPLTSVNFNYYAPQPAYAYIGRVALCPARITDAETTQLSSVLASCSGAELYKWFYDRGYYGTLILPLESDSRGYIVGGGSTPRDNYAYSTVAASTDTGYEVYA